MAKRNGTRRDDSHSDGGDAASGIDAGAFERRAAELGYDSGASGSGDGSRGDIGDGGRPLGEIDGTGSGERETSGGSGERETARAGSDNAPADAADAGTDRGSGDGDGSRRGRGRPKGSKTRARPDRPDVVRGVDDTPAPAPKDIPFAKVTGERTKAPAMRDSLAMFISVGFMLPKYAGYGQHWDLSEPEADDLAQHLDKCLKRLPKTKAAKLAKTIDKYAPFFGLAMAGYATVAPRVALTRELLALQAQERRNAQSSQDHNGGGFDPGQHDAGSANRVQVGTPSDLQASGTGSGSTARANGIVADLFSPPANFPIA